MLQQMLLLVPDDRPALLPPRSRTPLLLLLLAPLLWRCALLFLQVLLPLLGGESGTSRQVSQAPQPQAQQH